MNPQERDLYIQAVALQLGLQITPEDLPRVAAVYANLERVAAALLATPLDADLMAAAVFRPSPGDRS